MNFFQYDISVLVRKAQSNPIHTFDYVVMFTVGDKSVFQNRIVMYYVKT